MSLAHVAQFGRDSYESAVWLKLLATRIVSVWNGLGWSFLWFGDHRTNGRNSQLFSAILQLPL